MKLFLTKQDVNEQIKELLKDYSSQIAQLEKEIHDLKENENLKELSYQVAFSNKKIEELIKENISIQSSFSNVLSEIEKFKVLFNQQENDFKTELEIISHEIKDSTSVFEKIEKMDQQTEGYFKIVHDTISALSDIVMKKQSETIIPQKTIQKEINLSSYDRKIFNLEEKTNNLEEKLDISVELILDKLANKLSEEQDLPQQLLSDRCPFKPKQGYCSLWATRKNKTDAMTFCTSCIQASNLLDKGIRL